MSMHTLLLAILLSLPPAAADTENYSARTARMSTIAQAIGAASSRATCAGWPEGSKCKPIWPGTQKSLALLTLTVGWWESRFAQNVHAGKCKPYECDAARRAGRIVFLARTPWQMHKTGYTAHVWDKLIGTELEPTREAAWAAARILSDGRTSCGTNFGAVSRYANGRCAWRGAHNRIRFFKKLSEKSFAQIERASRAQQRALAQND